MKQIFSGLRLPSSGAAALLSTATTGNAVAIIALIGALTSEPVLAGPRGGVLKAGSGSIQTRTDVTTIRQSGKKLVIEWDSFDIDRGETVRFRQPGTGSVALNRVTGEAPTDIRGDLKANGNVWIVNRNGVTFHSDARVDVGGLLATTSDITNANFMAGRYTFDQPGATTAAVANEGEITFGEAGLAAFVGASAVNRGVISGKLGTVVVAGAETFAVDLAGDGMWSFTIGDGVSGATAINSGAIENSGGHVLISARAAQGMVDSTVSVGGLVEATSAEIRKGKIVLSGDGDVQVTGRLDVTGEGAVGGNVDVLGERVTIADGAVIDASGTAGGGQVRVGGDYRGSGVETATTTDLTRGALIKANATGSVGDGGRVLLWSDEATTFHGSIEARGGALGGDGGFVEVSGKERLAFDGWVDLYAPYGLNGELFLDPDSIEIVSGLGADDGEVADGGVLAGDAPLSTFQISADAIEAALENGNVSLAAENTIIQNNDAPIAYQDVASRLSLFTTSGDIVLNGGVAAGAGGFVASAGGSVRLGSDLASGGSISLAAKGVNGVIKFADSASIRGLDVTLSAPGPLVLGKIEAAGDLAVRSNADGADSNFGNGVTQTAPMSVAGDASFFTGDPDAVAAVNPSALADVTLDHPENVFGGNVSAVAANAILRGATSLTFADSRISGDLELLVSRGWARVRDVALGGSATIEAPDGVNIRRLAAVGDLNITVPDGPIEGGDISAGGTLAASSSGSVSLDAAQFAELEIVSGAAVAVSNIATGLFDISADDVAAESISVGGALNVAATGAVEFAGGLAGDVSIAAGSLRLVDLGVEGDVEVSTSSDAELSRLAATGFMSVDVGGDLQATDLQVDGLSNFSSGRQLVLDDFLLGDVSIETGGRISLSDGAASILSVTSGGRFDGMNLRLDDLQLETQGGLTLDAVQIVGDASLLARGGDILFGSVKVGGDLIAEAANEEIKTIDSDFVLEAVSIEGPGSAEATAFRIEGPNSAEIGFTGDGAFPTLAETLGVIVDTEVAGLNGFTEEAIDLPRFENTNLLFVGGDAYFVSGDDRPLDISLVDDDAGIKGDNDFVGGVSAVSGGAISINDANDFLIGAPAGITTLSGLVLNESGIRTDTVLRLEAGGVIREADGLTPSLNVGGDVLLLAGSNIDLDNGSHRIGGAISAAGNNISLSELATIRLGPIDAFGDLVVLAGAQGSLGAAAILQDSEVTVTDRMINGGGLVDRRQGPIKVVGESTFATDLELEIALDDAALSAVRSLRVDNPSNVFGDLSVARISGNATIVEESSPDSIGTDINDGDVLRIRNFEVGGRTRITTTDNVVFLGRLTSLNDGQVAGDRPARPRSSDPSDQGDRSLAMDSLRLFIPDGDGAFQVDTTGFGLDPAGRDVRFDRPVDGNNDAEPFSSATALAQRDLLGDLTIFAGTAGEVRFRDYLGAEHPVGDIRVEAGAFVTGTTFASFVPGANGPEARFLIDPAAPRDYLFANALNITVSRGDILALAPQAAFDQFETTDIYFGLNVRSFIFNADPLTSGLNAVGSLAGSRDRGTALQLIGPRNDAFVFNGCTLGDTSSCLIFAQPSTPQLEVNFALPPPILVPVEEDLLEIFGSFGNEELWGVPPSYFAEIDDEEGTSECEEQGRRNGYRPSSSQESCPPAPEANSN